MIHLVVSSLKSLALFTGSNSRYILRVGSYTSLTLRGCTGGSGEDIVITLIKNAMITLTLIALQYNCGVSENMINTFLLNVAVVVNAVLCQMTDLYTDMH